VAVSTAIASLLGLEMTDDRRRRPTTTNDQRRPADRRPRPTRAPGARRPTSSSASPSPSEIRAGEVRFASFQSAVGDLLSKSAESANGGGGAAAAAKVASAAWEGMHSVQVVFEAEA
jgi:hypothetical protein